MSSSGLTLMPTGLQTHTHTQTRSIHTFSLSVVFYFMRNKPWTSFALCLTMEPVCSLCSLCCPFTSINQRKHFCSQTELTSHVSCRHSNFSYQQRIRLVTLGKLVPLVRLYVRQLPLQSLVSEWSLQRPSSPTTSPLTSPIICFPPLEKVPK